MRLIERMPLVLGAVLVAAALYALMAAPGLVSDRESTVGKLQLQEARRCTPCCVRSAPCRTSRAG